MTTFGKGYILLHEKDTRDEINKNLLSGMINRVAVYIVIDNMGRGHTNYRPCKEEDTLDDLPLIKDDVSVFFVGFFSRKIKRGEIGKILKSREDEYERYYMENMM